MIRQNIVMSSESRFFSFAYLRQAAHHAFEIARKVDGGSNYSRVTAGMFCALTVEAYLNHLGETEFGLWDEKKKNLPWKTKLQTVAEKVGVTVNFDCRPYQTIGRCFRLRDSLAHGRDHDTSIEYQFPENKSDRRQPDPDFIQWWWDDENVRLGLDDLESILKQLQTAAGLDPKTRNPSAH